MTSDQPYIPFSQRMGLAPIPPQLKLGEVSTELRRLLDYYVGLEIDRETRSGYESSYFDDSWQRVAMDLHVVFFEQNASTFKNDPYKLKRELELCFRGEELAQCSISLNSSSVTRSVAMN
jgi:hypothetical protein